VVRRVSDQPGMKLLAGSRACVLGGGQGIGRAVATGLAAAGARVAVVDRDLERAEAVVAELEDGYAIGADVCERDSLERAVDEVFVQFGGLDSLVTVVGGHSAFFPYVPLHEVTPEDWAKSFAMNIDYVADALRLVLPRVIEQPGGASIVSVGSLSGLVSAPRHGAYGAAKAGLSHLARTVAAEYGRFGVRMNVVAPGAIETPAVDGIQDEEQIEKMSARIPLQRRGLPHEIAGAVVFFASQMSGYVTGQTLVVDGGMSVHYPAPLRDSHPSESG
jgi:3-oxoacyl-[acyl-carrier protein] reductase